ncbi:MAG: ACP S-malonyltransferase [Halanaerobiales bacterium]|nr:ACP S-malonyltransferase [Halanaerobiales bacterium]
MNNNLAFIFPGQGSQYVGMGNNFYEKYDIAKDYFNRANKILDIDLKEICFNGPETKLKETQNTQPAIFTVSVIGYQLLKSKDIVPGVVAGHSLGEYSALYAAEVYDFETGLKLVRKRGELMSKAVSEGSKGKMAAIIALDKKKIEEICSKVKGVCQIANINSPLQIVISGEDKAINQAIKLADQSGAKKVVELKVSSAFHSKLMEPAKKKLAEYINSLDFKNPQIPIIANSTADFVNTKSEIVNALKEQLTNPVRWVESMELAGIKGIEKAVEIGPGRVLKTLMRRIDRSIKTYNLEDEVSLKKTVNKI